MPDADTIEAVFRQVTREVWIVTAVDGERRGGLLATWVARTSHDPAAPVVMIAVSQNHFTRELIDGSGAFALHTITAEQIALAWQFCLGSGQSRDKLSGLEYRTELTGSPVLEDSLSWLDCRVFERYDGGDRIYYWAEVLTGGQNAAGIPLTDQQLFAAASSKQKEELLASLQADIEVQRPLYANWRKKLERSTRS